MRHPRQPAGLRSPGLRSPGRETPRLRTALRISPRIAHWPCEPPAAEKYVHRVAHPSRFIELDIRLEAPGGETPPGTADNDRYGEAPGNGRGGWGPRAAGRPTAGPPGGPPRPR